MLLFLIIGVFRLSIRVQKQQNYLRWLDKKLDLLLEYHGIELPPLSPEVQALARKPNTQIAAIKLHLDQHPDLNLLKAKAEIDAFVAEKR